MTDTNTQLARGGLEAVVDAGVASAGADVLDIDEVYSVALPPGSTHHVVDLERFRPEPSRVRGRVDLYTGQSLVSYVTAHKEAGTSLYADVEARRVVAVLNGHVEANSPGWSDHRAVLTLRPTPPWQFWLAKHGQLVDQQAFAEHVEEGLDEIQEPPGADLLELAQSFEATTGAQFKSALRLDNGERQLTYEETVAARAGQQGNITIPREFTLGLQPFEGAPTYRVTARLRYRIREGRLAIGYQLVRSDDVVREAFDAVLEDIEHGCDRNAYRGTPPPDVS